jgi:hypothetical protein
MVKRSLFLKYIITGIGLWSLTIACRAPHSEDPEAAFQALEERLLNARAVKLAFHITAAGAVSADFHGTLEMEKGTGILLQGRGTFAGDSVDIELRSDNYQVELANRSGRTVTGTPRELREALLIGLCRMGILHNLARLTGYSLPDHAEGGVRDWVLVDSFTVDPQCNSGISFAIIAAGEPVGSAILEIAPAGQPVKRHQTVHFPTGEMRVVEQYSDVIITQ